MSATVAARSISAATAPIETIIVDLYRDVHKGIRNELFNITARLGNLDPDDADQAAIIGGRTRWFFELLDAHATHEDHYISAVLTAIDGSLDERVRADHAHLDTAMAEIDRLRAAVISAPRAARRLATRRWYLAFASFTSAYLAHEATEELEVMPTLASAMGPGELAELEGAIIGAITPDHFAGYLTLILPAANPHERANLVGGIKAAAPEEVFTTVAAIAEQVMSPVDHARLLRDLA